LKGEEAMTDSSSSLGSQLGKKAIRFAVAILGLLLLKAVVDALPMLKSASLIDGTLLSPVVLANVIVDTLIMVVIFGFGLAVSRDLRRFYPSVPDLGQTVLLLAVLLVLVLAYNLYEVPLACILVSPTDLWNSGTGSVPSDVWGQVGVDIRGMMQQLANGISPQLAEAAKGPALAGLQKLAIAKMRQPTDLYGWIFLILAAIPVVGLVVIGSRNLDAISDHLFRKASTVGAGPQPKASGSSAVSHMQRRMAATLGGGGSKELSSEDMDKLIRLKTLLDQGAITQADFDAQKRMILQEPLAQEEPAELQRLKQLLDAGALTQEEYDVQKQRFLARM
jgi:hypothetical protein